MNQRIKELLDIAQGSIEPMDEQANVFEKFAELIVQECTSVVKDAVDHREPASTYVGKIKEHFGVKE